MGLISKYEQSSPYIHYDVMLDVGGIKPDPIKNRQDIVTLADHFFIATEKNSYKFVYKADKNNEQ